MGKTALLIQQYCSRNKQKTKGETVMQVGGNGCWVETARPHLLQAVKDMLVYFECKPHMPLFLRICV